MFRNCIKFLLALSLVAGAAFRAGAVSAWPYPIDVTQPDGSTITIHIHGDEYFSWITSEGRTVKMSEDGFYRECAFDYAGMMKGSQLRAAARGGIAPSVQGLSAAPGLSATGSLSHGEKHFLVLLIEFSDLRFTVGDAGSAFDDLLNSDHYDYGNATGSVKEYFTDQSHSKFTPVFDVVGPVKVKLDAASYAKDKGMTQESGAPKLLKDACDILDAQGFDFSQYDLDKDGYIDNIFFYFAGHNMAEGADGTIWPHKWQVNSAPVYDGVHLWTYACTSEYSGKSGQTRCSIGTFCHEFSHVLGLPDFYDVNGSEEGNSSHPGNYSLMAGGNYNNNGNTPPYFNIEERALLGWLDGTEDIEVHTRIMEAWKYIEEMPLKSEVLTLAPVQDNAAYRSPTDKEDEYYLYEYRNGEKWDKYIGSGVLIYHVDKSETMAGKYSAFKRWTDYGWSGCINDAAVHPCFLLLPAEGNSYGNAAPFGNSVTRFTATTTPGALCWSGRPSNYNLISISHDGEQAELMLSYDAPGAPFRVSAIDIREEGYAAGDTLELKLLPSEDEPEQTDWYLDSEQQTGQSVTLSAGHHLLEARLVFSDGRSGWYQVELNVD